jgi:hypothetical protein
VPQNKHVTRKEKVYFLLTAIALSVSVAALVIACRHTVDAAYIIGVLAVLVTVLIGWNIYSLIDFNGKTEKIEGALRAEFKEEIAREVASAKYASAGIAMAQSGLVEYNNEKYGSAFLILMNALILLERGADGFDLAMEARGEAVRLLCEIAEYLEKNGNSIKLPEGSEKFYAVVAAMKDISDSDRKTLFRMLRRIVND